MFHDISPHMWKEYIETLTYQYHGTPSPSRVCTTNLLPIRLCPSSTSFLSPHRTRHVVYPLAGWPTLARARWLFMPQKSSARARPFAAREEGTNSGGEKVAECGAAVIFICAGGSRNLDDHLPREARVLH